MLNAGRRWAGIGAWALALVLAWGASGRAEDPEAPVGTRVVTRRGVALRDGHRRVEPRARYLAYSVEDVSGEWRLLAADGLKGWVKAADLIPCDEAVAHFSQIIEAQPAAGWAYAMRGLVYEELNEPRIALSDYHMAIRLDSGDAGAYLLRGRLLAEAKKDYDRAIADYGHAIRLVPRLAAAYVLRGDAFRAREDYARAVGDYEAAIRLDPKDPRAYHGRALAWLAKGDPGRAIDDLGEAFRLRPEDPVALVNLGNAWADKHDYDRALSEYNEAIRLDPGAALAYNNRGLAWREKKEFARAAEDHSQAIRLDPRDATSYFYRGLARKALGDYGRALADYNEAIRLDPGFAEAHNVRAWLQATCPQDAFRDGKAAYDSAVRACTLTGWSGAADLDTLAACYAESHDFARAVEWEAKAIGLAKEEPERAKFRARLDLYRANRPYRDPALK